MLLFFEIVQLLQASSNATWRHSVVCGVHDSDKGTRCSAQQVLARKPFFLSGPACHATSNPTSPPQCRVVGGPVHSNFYLLTSKQITRIAGQTEMTVAARARPRLGAAWPGHCPPARSMGPCPGQARPALPARPGLFHIFLWYKIIFNP